MRLILAALISLLPAIAFAQESIPAKSTEVSFNAGTAFGKGMAAITDQFEYATPVRGSGGFLINRGSVQYGVLLELGSHTAVQWYMSPTFVGNFRIVGKRDYAYAGITVGYFYSEDGGYDFNVAFRVATGYQSGMQLGYVRELGGGFGVNADFGLRAIRTMRKTQVKVPTNSPTPPYYTLEAGEKVAKDIFLFPLTLGIRYRFGGGNR